MIMEFIGGETLPLGIPLFIRRQVGSTDTVTAPRVTPADCIAFNPHA